MNAGIVPLANRAPALVAAAGEHTSCRFFEFFTAQIRNPHTRRAYARAAQEFFAWLAARGVTQLTAIESMHVAAYIEALQKARSAPTAKLRLAALRHLFDWLVIGQIMPGNPAAAVRGPRHIVRRGKTPVLDPSEPRQLIDAINVATVIGLRDRALIGLMVYSSARFGAALGLRVEDVYSQNRRLWTAQGKGRQAARHALPSQSRRLSARLRRGCRALSGIADVASFALGTTGTYILFRGSLRLGLALLAASLFLHSWSGPSRLVDE